MFCVRLYLKKFYKIILGHKTCKKTKNFPTENIFKKKPQTCKTKRFCMNEGREAKTASSGVQKTTQGPSS